MKATGIVRRIDDLGRIVIPKEIRKTLKVKEGMPLEIYTDQEGGIILKNTFPFPSFRRWRRSTPSAYSSRPEPGSSSRTVRRS